MKIIINTNVVFWLFAIVPFTVCAQKKIYHSGLDSLWSNEFSIAEITTDGNWMLTLERSEFKPVEYKLVRTNPADKFELKHCLSPQFSKDSKWMAFISEDSELKLFNLASKEIKSFGKSTKFEFNKDGSMFAYLKKDNDSLNILSVYNLKNDLFSEVTGIEDFKWNPTKDILTAVEKDGNIKQLISSTPFGASKILTECSDCSFPVIEWNESGKALLVLKKVKDKFELLHFDSAGTMRVLNESVIDSKFPDHSINDFGLKISSDGKRVFFIRQKNNEVFQAEETVEVWNTDDIWVYPQLRSHQENTMTLLTLWEPESGVLMAIEDEKYSTSKAHPDIDIALVYDLRQYEPTYEQNSYADIYALDLHSGSKKLLVEKQYTDLNFMSISPSGKYVSFFRENNWWIYDTYKEMLTNITQKIPVIWFNKYHFRIKNPSVISSPYWSVDEKYLILHDEYDVWQISVDGAKRKRLTKGIESKISYKVVFDEDKKGQTDKLANSIGLTLDLSKPILFKMKGEDLKTGIAVWKSNNGTEKLFYHEKNTDHIQRLNKTEILFSTSLYNESPLFSRMDIKTKQKHAFLQTNPGFNEYDFGKSEFFRFKPVNKDSLNAALLYPSGYDPSKKYPMIVMIYENISGNVLNFSPPIERHSANYNFYKFINNGYFVLLPDISYQIGNPGFSAVECVSSAVKKAAEINSAIDMEKMGLMGFSFGGYQAAFIATQTNMFKAVVAGATMTDMVSYYHDIAFDFTSDQAWRMENQQFRMGKPFYNLKENYYQNSPLYHVEKLQTPLLLWTGKEDYNVNWYQSLYMYSAMKRLNKKGKLLLFKDEKHSVTKKENLERLSKEVFDWFEHYLK